MGNDPSFREAAEEIGRMIAGEGDTLIYGGSGVGLMGILADAALSGGAEVIGVEPQFFLDRGLLYEGITKTIPTETMAERKVLMMEMGDAYIALPGGIGTLDEITEVITLAALDRHRKPCILYNKNGYYDPLAEVFDRMTAAGFLSEAARKKVHFAADADEIRAILKGTRYS